MAQRKFVSLSANTEGSATVTAAADRERGSQTIDVEVKAVLVEVLKGTEPVYVGPTTGLAIRGDDLVAVPAGGYKEVVLGEPAESVVVFLKSAAAAEVAVEAVMIER